MNDIKCGECFCLIDDAGLGYGVCEFDMIEKSNRHVCDFQTDDTAFVSMGVDIRTGKHQYNKCD